MSEAQNLYRHRGTRAIQRMVEFAPATGGLALWVRHEDLAGEARALAPLTTDGNSLYYGPRFEELPIEEQTAWVAHEVLHIALRHPQRLRDLRLLLGDVDLNLFNICADAIVNSTLSHLTWLTLPSSAVHLDKLLVIVLGEKHSVETALLNWDVEKLYRAIDDRRLHVRGEPRKSEDEKDGGAARSGGPREDGPRAARVRMMGVDIAADLIPGPDRRCAPESDAEEARTWSERLLRAHASDGEHSILRTLVADVPRTRTPWEQVLRTQLAHSLSARPGISWSRPSRSHIANQGRAGPHRRLPWTPGISAVNRAPRLVVIVDVSGSIEGELLNKFAREIEAISRRQESRLVLIIGDDEVRRVTEFTAGQSDLWDISFVGGGGTDFTSLLEEADKHKPDVVVVLTDLDGPTRYRPRCPVIWAVPEAHAAAAQPFGRKLTLS